MFCLILGQTIPLNLDIFKYRHMCVAGKDGDTSESSLLVPHTKGERKRPPASFQKGNNTAWKLQGNP